MEHLPIRGTAQAIYYLANVTPMPFFVNDASASKILIPESNYWVRYTGHFTIATLSTSYVASWIPSHNGPIYAGQVTFLLLKASDYCARLIRDFCSAANLILNTIDADAKNCELLESVLRQGTRKRAWYAGTRG